MFSVISAKKYMQLLMTEEEQTCLIMMILTQNILRADMYVILKVLLGEIIKCKLQYLMYSLFIMVLVLSIYEIKRKYSYSRVI